jgi:hypothetical protein
VRLRDGGPERQGRWSSDPLVSALENSLEPTDQGMAFGLDTPRRLEVSRAVSLDSRQEPASLPGSTRYSVRPCVLLGAVFRSASL